MVDHRFETVSNGDIDIRVAVAGEGPLMLFVHGWPELWYSWRHQMDHFADRYTVAAMDVRGYGGSSKPVEIERYSLQELASDAAAVIDAMGGSAIVVGHDWGAPIAWQTARLHADKVSAVAGLSVPYLPIGPDSAMELWDLVYADKFFYMKYFQAPGVAEAELGADTARSLRMVWYSASADGRGAMIMDKPADATMLDGLVDPDPFPAWSTPSRRSRRADGPARSTVTGRRVSMQSSSARRRNRRRRSGNRPRSSAESSTRCGTSSQDSTCSATRVPTVPTSAVPRSCRAPATGCSRRRPRRPMPRSTSSSPRSDRPAIVTGAAGVSRLRVCGS